MDAGSEFEPSNDSVSSFEIEADDGLQADECGKRCIPTTDDDEAEADRPRDVSSSFRWCMCPLLAAAVVCFGALAILVIIVAKDAYGTHQPEAPPGTNHHHQHHHLFAPDFRRVMGTVHDAPANFSWQLHDGNITFEIEIRTGTQDHATTIGWLGFGIADPHSMKMAGADMAIVEGLHPLASTTTKASSPTVTDMFTSVTDPDRRHEPPTTDLETVQNWHLLAAEQDDSTSTLRVRITRTRTEGLDPASDRPLPVDDLLDTTLLLAFGPENRMPRDRGHGPKNRMRYAVNLETGVDNAARFAAIKNRPGVKKAIVRVPLEGVAHNDHLFVLMNRTEVLADVRRQLNLSTETAAKETPMPLPLVLFGVAHSPPYHHVTLVSCVATGPACLFDFNYRAAGAMGEAEGYEIQDASPSYIGLWKADSFYIEFHAKVSGPISAALDLELWIDTHLNDKLMQEAKGDTSRGQIAFPDSGGMMHIFHNSLPVAIPKYKNSVPAVLTWTVSSECTRFTMLKPLRIDSLHPHTHHTGLRFAFSFRNSSGHEYAAVDSTAHDYSSEYWRQLKRPVEVSPGDQFVLQCIYYPKTNDVRIQAGPHEEMCLMITRVAPLSAWAPGSDKIAPFEWKCRTNVTVMPLDEAKQRNSLLRYTGWRP